MGKRARARRRAGVATVPRESARLRHRASDGSANGNAGPWEELYDPRTVARLAFHFTPLVATWANRRYLVHLLRHDCYPGVDHLLVERHDGAVEIAWGELQAMKDELLPDGRTRWAIEVYPATSRIVDEAPMRHLWAMPTGWVSPVDFHAMPPIPVVVS